jgi:hypothetical protein
MTGPRSARVERLPLVLLGVMTVLCFGGPFGILWVLKGGAAEGWPPDRPVEWVALVGSCALVAGLMVVLLVMNLRATKAIRAERQSRAEERSRAAP